MHWLNYIRWSYVIFFKLDFGEKFDLDLTVKNKSVLNNEITFRHFKSLFLRSTVSKETKKMFDI